MPKQVSIQLLPEDNGNNCSDSQHAEAFPARFEVTIQDTEPTIDFLCQHHLTVAARNDADVKDALGQVGELTKIGDSAFQLDLKKNA